MLNRIDQWLKRHSFDYYLRQRYKVFLRSIKPELPEIVVFQMGKVGSSSVTATLGTFVKDHQIFQIHVLSEDWISKVTEQYRAASRAHGVPSIDRHILASRYLNARLKAHPHQGKWQLISLVREPVGRNVSSFFQAFPVYFPVLAAASDASAINRHDPQELTRVFIEEFGEYRHSVPTIWFQTHMEPAFGIDVYAEHFDTDTGYRIYENDRARLLLLRAEDVDRVFLEAFEEFSGMRLPKLIRKNDANDKVYADTYGEFKEYLDLPASYVDGLYSSRYMQHFYSPSEIATFRERWLRSSEVNNDQGSTVDNGSPAQQAPG